MSGPPPPRRRPGRTRLERRPGGGRRTAQASSSRSWGRPPWMLDGVLVTSRISDRPQESRVPGCQLLLVSCPAASPVAWEHDLYHRSDRPRGSQLRRRGHIGGLVRPRVPSERRAVRPRRPAGALRAPEAELTADRGKRRWFTAAADEPGSLDICFITTATPDEVVEHLRACEVAPEVGPVATSGALGAMISVYCRDPDGNLIEFATYDNGEDVANAETR